MKPTPSATSQWRSRVVRRRLALVPIAIGVVLVTVAPVGAAAVAVPLATATSFVVLAGSGVTNTGPTTLGGDLGTYPTTSITGTSTLTVNGTDHDGDAVTQQAKSDLVTAYSSAASEGPTIPIVADLGGQTLTPGVYNSPSSIGLTGAVTLNGGGNPNSVFVFQAGSALTTASGSEVNLIGGAQACNVYWQVASSATLGTGSSFVGTVIALTSITVTSGATISGRVLARNGAVTLDSDTVNAANCAATTSTTTAGVGATPTTTTPAAATTTPGAAATTKGAAVTTTPATTAAAANKVGATTGKSGTTKTTVATSTSPLGSTTTTVPGSFNRPTVPVTISPPGFSEPPHGPVGFTG